MLLAPLESKDNPMCAMFVKEANKIIVKESSITKEELEYIIRQQFDELDETFYLARENNNPSVMAGVNKAKNAAIRNYVAIKRDLDYPEMWQNQMDNESKRQSFGGIDRLEDRLEKKDHLLDSYEKFRRSRKKN